MHEAALHLMSMALFSCPQSNKKTGLQDFSCKPVFIGALVGRRQQRSRWEKREGLACFCTSLMLTLANQKNGPSAGNFNQSDVGFLNPTNSILDPREQVA